MKIIFFGTSSFGISSLEILKKSSHEIQSIVTIPDKPKGRNLKVENSPVKEWALRNKIPHLEAVRGNLDKLKEKCEALKPDLFVVISFGAILPENLLSIPKILPLNVHSSLLPRWRGAAPMHWALASGDSHTGVSVIRMTPKCDAGDIVTLKKTSILEEDDIISLEDRLSRLGAEALLEAITLVEEKKAVFIPQDEKCATVARKLTKEDGRINWKLKAAEIHNRIRAMKEWPTSYTFYQGKRLILTDTQISTPGVENAVPGTVLAASAMDGIVVAAGAAALRIQHLQLEGKKPLESRAFLMGFPLKVGEVFE